MTSCLSVSRLVNTDSKYALIAARLIAASSRCCTVEVISPMTYPLTSSRFMITIARSGSSVAPLTRFAEKSGGMVIVR